MVCRLKPASFQENSRMGWGCSPVYLLSRGEREGGLLSSSPPPWHLGQGSRESKAQGKGTKPALEGYSAPLSPRGKQHGHPPFPPQLLCWETRLVRMTTLAFAGWGLVMRCAVLGAGVRRPW